MPITLTGYFPELGGETFDTATEALFFLDGKTGPVVCTIHANGKGVSTSGKVYQIRELLSVIAKAEKVAS